MTEASQQDKITTRCTHCGKAFRVNAAYLNKKAKCSACQQAFVVQRLDPPVENPRGKSGQGLCVICQYDVSDTEVVTTCTECKTIYHHECWEYNQGCGMYGCSYCPETEGLSSLEVPASHWGREDKQCPKCNTTIQAAAVRCRQCGASFASADPESQSNFQQRDREKQQLPGIRKSIVWLLVFSLIPCTAPIAAVVGVIWYRANRGAIQRLPALSVALCKIAIGTAILETCIVVLAMMFHGMFG